MFEAEHDDMRFERHPWLDLWALPGAILLSLLAEPLILPALLLNGMRIWIHEFGHAFIAWWSSRAALPLGIGFTSYNLQSSWFVTLCFTFLMGLGFVKAWAHQYFYWAFLCAFSFIMMILFSFVFSDQTFLWCFSFGGVAGEIYLSSLLIIAFYCEGSHKIRWDFLRFPVLFIATYVYLQALKLWWGVSHMTREIPFGTLWGGQGDAGGDMNQLRDNYGWTETSIAETYWRWCVACGLLISAVWILNLLLQMSRGSSRSAGRSL